MLRNCPPVWILVLASHISFFSFAPPVPPSRYILELLKKDLKPRDIMTYKAFENAMVTIMATGEGGRDTQTTL